MVAVVSCGCGLHQFDESQIDRRDGFRAAAGASRSLNFPLDIPSHRICHFDCDYPPVPAPMDPLSVSASLIAIIGLAATVAKSLEDLRTTIRDASSDLCSLINEISDLRIVLDAITTALKEWESSKSPQPLSDLGLSHILNQTEKRLNELNNLVVSCITYEGSTSTIRAAKFRWFRERKRIKSTQTAIRDKKQDLAALLGAYNLSGIGKLQMSIHKIRIGTERIQRDNQIYELLSEQILEKLPLADQKSEELLPSYQQSQGPRDVKGNLLSMIHDAELIRVQASFHRRATCNLLCPCRCHQRGSFSTPAFTRRFVGSLFVGYSGIPLMTATCNEKMCRQRAETRVVVSYQFPKWFWSQAFLKAIIAVSSLSGPEILIRAQRTYPYASEIYQYCLDGNIPGLKRLFETRVVSPFDVDLDGRSLLHNALRGTNPYNACHILITAGADVHQEDQEGISPFDAAWDIILLSPTSQEKKETKSSKLIELFPLSEGGLDERQFSRLHKVALGIIKGSLKDELEISTALIDEGDNLGRTPLFWAASRGDIEAVSILLEYGADPRICRNIGPLHAAASGGHSTILRMLLEKGGDVDSRCTFQTTPLMRAAACDKGSECIEILLEFGADINAQDAALNFPLLEAVQNALPENTKALLAKNPNINMVEHEGWTALASGVFWKERGTTSCIPLLLEAGADYLTLTVSGDNILHNAAQYVGVTTLRTLTAGKLTKLDPNAKNFAGMTPLDLADCRTDVDDEWWEAFQALIESTVDENKVVNLSELETGVDLKNEPVSVRVIDVTWEDYDDEVFEDAVEEL